MLSIPLFGVRRLSVLFSCAFCTSSRLTISWSRLISEPVDFRNSALMLHWWREAFYLVFQRFPVVNKLVTAAPVWKTLEVDVIWSMFRIQRSPRTFGTAEGYNITISYKRTPFFAFRSNFVEFEARPGVVPKVVPLWRVDFFKKIQDGCCVSLLNKPAKIFRIMERQSRGGFKKFKKRGWGRLATLLINDSQSKIVMLVVGVW